MVKKCLINDDLIKKCYDNLLLGMSQTACAKSIGVASSTWFNWQRLALEGKRPYADWWLQCQKAEADLQARCLESVKLAMDHGDPKAAMFLLSTKFAGEGFGKSSNVNMIAENKNLNLNVNTGPQTWESKEQMRKEICGFFDKLNKGNSPE